jgi:hypothetical protein
MTTLPWPAENAALLQVNAPGAPDAYGDVANPARKCGRARSALR